MRPTELRLRSTHTVKLTWKASSSQVVVTTCIGVRRPNSITLRLILRRFRNSFTDVTVESGLTYYYVARAVDARGYESTNSNEASATIP